MAEPEHNQLDDLFKKSGSDSLDDFEREALEGFNSLESQQEAHDFQKKVDQRAQKELFGKKEKSKPFVYWYAAAGLFLVVGLGAYFILNRDELNNKKNVAALEENAQVFNKPDQSAPVGNSEYQADVTKGKEKEEIKSPAETVTNNLQDQAKKADKYTGPLADEKAVSGGRSDNDGDLLKKAQTKEPAAKALEQKSEPVITDNLAMAQPETEKTKEEIARPAQAQKNDAPYGNFHQEKEGKKTADASNVMDDRETAKDGMATGKAQQPDGEMPEKRAKEKHEKNRKKSNSQAAPGLAENNEAASKNADKNYKYGEAKPSEEKKEVTNGTFAGAGAGNNNANASSASTGETKGYYDGGESELKKDLHEKLKQNNVNKKFDATLFINDKKQVEKVSFTKGDLSKEQQEKIEAVLKSLDKFRFTEGKLKAGFFEYKLSYKP